MINTQDFLRYNRPMSMLEIGVEGQLKIKNASVLIIGAGGLGCPISLYLTTSGVGTLGVIDFDTVEIHNLHRQILYTEKDINQSKVDVLKKRLNETNPHINIHIYNERLTEDNCSSILKNYDYIVDGSDNFTTRYLVNDNCVALDKTLVYGSILGFEGQIAIFNRLGSKDLRSVFPEPPSPKNVPNCSLNGVLGPLPGIIGTMMAQETLKLILDLPHLCNQLLCIDTMHWRFTTIQF